MQKISSSFFIPTKDIDHVFKVVGNNWKKLSNQRLLITGGTGFIGKWMLSTFLHANRELNLSAKVVVVSRNPESFLKNFPNLRDCNDICWVKKDIRELTPEDCGECSFSIHSATDVNDYNNSVEIFDSCVLGTKRVLNAMNLYRGRKRMLLLSSGAVYGQIPSNVERISEDSYREFNLIETEQDYAASKRVSEFQSLTYASENPGFEVAIARCFSLVGPYLSLNKNFAISDFIRSAINNEDINIYGDGTPLRSYLYAADLSHWLWKILFDAPTGRSYNVGGSKSISILELALKVNTLIGSSGRIKILKKLDLNNFHHSYLPSLNRIFTELNLSEAFSLDQAIIKTASWLKTNFNVNSS
jgi:dTDP-glucose 4,6-dehydratase